jgi:hypothetical protein
MILGSFQAMSCLEDLAEATGSYSERREANDD